MLLITPAVTPKNVVKFNGQPMKDCNVRSLQVVELLDGPSMCTFRVPAVGPNTWEFQPLDQAIASFGTEVEIRVGDVVLFLGDIARLSFEFSKSDPTVTLTAYDRRYRLQRGLKPRNPFTDQSACEIVETVVRDGDYALTPVVFRNDASTATIENVTKPQGGSDLELLQRCAELIDFDLLVLGKELHFRPPQTHEKPSLVLDARTNLREFSAQFPEGPQPESVSIAWDDHKTKRKEKKNEKENEPQFGVATIHDIKPMVLQNSDADDSKTGTNKKQSTPRLGPQWLAPLGSSSVVQDKFPVANKDRAVTIARAQLEHLTLNFVSVSGTCDGRPDLRIGSLIAIQNVGTVFSGPYLVNSTTHAFASDGYITTFNARRNAL